MSAQNSSLYVEVKTTPPNVVKKGGIQLNFGPEYLRPLVIIDLEGPESSGVTYLSFSQLKEMARRARNKLFRKCNVGIPVEKMSDLVKTYPKLVGRRRCTGIVEKELSQEKIKDLQRGVKIKPDKQGYIRMHIGHTTEKKEIVDSRISGLLEYMEAEGYKVNRTLLGKTQGPTKLHR